jgi:hypothetical protein
MVESQFVFATDYFLVTTKGVWFIDDRLNAQKVGTLTVSKNDFILTKEKVLLTKNNGFY